MALPLRDRRRIELFSFLAEAIDSPNAVAFDQDDEGLRFTLMEHVQLVWRVDLVRTELDVVDVWDSFQRGG
jgi:hypothetical protein